MAVQAQARAVDPTPGGIRGSLSAIGQQVRVPKTAELVAAQLRRQIVRGELVEGDALPPEATLMDQFGVSRPTLREAYRVLESEALLSVRRGAHGGARVHTPNGDVAARYAALVLEHRGTTVADIFQARGVIEPPCAALLATRRTEKDLVVLRNAISAQAEADDPSDAMGVHQSFHHLVVELSRNRTLTVVSDMIGHIIEMVTTSYLAADSGSAQNRRAMTRAHRAHEKLVELIAARKAAEAEAMWRKHLLEAGDYLLNGPSPETLLDLMG
jgi:DNA-binding FadR family transcriptional regulator